MKISPVRVVAGLLPALLTACATPPNAPAPVTVGIAAINDFHGNLEPPRQSVAMPGPDGQLVQVPSGGAAWLASAIDAVRGKYANHLTVSAGDLIGGTPITSALFVDEPSIEVMNRIGLDFNAVGNHEFDSGLDELRRKQAGGCAQHTARKPCQVESFRGAQFPFLAANTLTTDGKTLFPAFAIRSFGKGRSRVKVGIIGMTLKGTGGLIPTDVAAQVKFTDEAETANALVGKLKAQGADAIVLLIHQGSRTGGEPNPNGCEKLAGDIGLVLDRLDTGIDVVVSGHTHWDYVCNYGSYNPAKPFLLTSAGLWGKLVTDITLEIDPRQHRVVAKRATNVVVQSPSYTASRGVIPNTDLVARFAPRTDIAEYVGKYVQAASAFSQRKVGRLGAEALKRTGPDGNSGGPLGNLVADAQLAATRGAGAQIAFMNPFGIRRSLTPAADGSVTFGDIYAVQPFNNELVTLTYTGAEIKEILEQGLDAIEPEQLLAPSEGFAFQFDRSRQVGDRVVSMTLLGVPIDPAKDYRVTVSQFLANGGDSFATFAKGRDKVTGPIDVDALEAWLQAIPPRMPPLEVRAIDARPDLNKRPDTTRAGVTYR